jgi:hypothetical protein
MNRVSIATLAASVLVFLATWLHQAAPANAAPAATYEFRLVTAGTSPEDLIKSLDDTGAQGYHAVGLVCLANVNQYATSPCVAQILMERQHH